jgi:hypothetical protein
VYVPQAQQPKAKLTTNRSPARKPSVPTFSSQVDDPTTVDPSWRSWKRPMNTVKKPSLPNVGIDQPSPRVRTSQSTTPQPQTRISTVSPRSKSSQAIANEVRMLGRSNSGSTNPSTNKPPTWKSNTVSICINLTSHTLGHINNEDDTFKDTKSFTFQ